MRRVSYIVLLVVLWALVAMFAGGALQGCKPGEIDQYLKARQQAETVRVATTQAAGDLQVVIDALPPDDPVRKAAESKMKQLNEALVKIDAALPKLDAAVAAVQQGNFTDPSVREAVKDIPYGSLAVGVVGILIGFYQRLKAQRAAQDLGATASALSQTVSGIENAKPKIGDTAATFLHEELAKSQDQQSKALVSQMKLAS